MLPRLWNAFETPTHFADFESFFDSFHALANQLEPTRQANGSYSAPVDMHEHEDRFECWFDLPGVAREDVKLSLENDTLTIEAARPAQAETEASSKLFHHVERWTGSFTRAFALPSSVDGTRVEATLKDGVLKLVLPKRDQAKARSIPITG